MQGTAEAVDAKNKFLQDVNCSTSYHFSNGPSLNRILVFQDHVVGERGSYVFNSSLISVSFEAGQLDLPQADLMNFRVLNKQDEGLFRKATGQYVYTD